MRYHTHCTQTRTWTRTLLGDKHTARLPLMQRKMQAHAFRPTDVENEHYINSAPTTDKGFCLLYLSVMARSPSLPPNSAERGSQLAGRIIFLSNPSSYVPKRADKSGKEKKEGRSRKLLTSIHARFWYLFPKTCHLSFSSLLLPSRC